MPNLLTAQGTDCWTLARPLRLLGMTMSSRMTVVRLADGTLWLHSPVQLDDALRRALDTLGPVRHLLAPNRFHHLFLQEYVTTYPGARLYAAPGLPGKRRDLHFDTVLTAPVPEWQADLEQLWVQGAPLLNEVVFLHRASRTLILTDLAFNVGPRSPFGLRLWARLNRAYGRLQPTLAVRLVVRDRMQMRSCLDRILDWEFERIVVSHGEVVTQNAKPAFSRACIDLAGKKKPGH